jgi:hypothetical protein
MIKATEYIHDLEKKLSETKKENEVLRKKVLVAEMPKGKKRAKKESAS